MSASAAAHAHEGAHQKFGSFQCSKVWECINETLRRSVCVCHCFMLIDTRGHFWTGNSIIEFYLALNRIACVMTRSKT